MWRSRPGAEWQLCHACFLGHPSHQMGRHPAINCPAPAALPRGSAYSQTRCSATACQGPATKSSLKWEDNHYYLSGQGFEALRNILRYSRTSMNGRPQELRKPLAYSILVAQQGATLCAQRFLKLRLAGRLEQNWRLSNIRLVRFECI